MIAAKNNPRCRLAGMITNGGRIPLHYTLPVFMRSDYRTQNKHNARCERAAVNTA